MTIAISLKHRNSSSFSRIAMAEAINKKKKVLYLVVDNQIQDLVSI